MKTMQNHTWLVVPGQVEGPVRIMDVTCRYEGVVPN